MIALIAHVARMDKNVHDIVFYFGLNTSFLILFYGEVSMDVINLSFVNDLFSKSTITFGQ